ncbi:MAG: hypothetical protein V8T00_01155 [Oscillospiraceae bacterium]
MAGNSPDLFAFYSDGDQAPPLAPRAVCADLRELLPDVTEDSLLPGLFDLLTQDGALYVLPLTVRVDTLIMPSNLIDSPGVTLEDLETARENMPPAGCRSIRDTRPENLFGLTAGFCIGRFVDRETGTCRFETQEFSRYSRLVQELGRRRFDAGSTRKNAHEARLDFEPQLAGLARGTSQKSGLTALGTPTRAIRSVPAAAHIWC